MLNALMGVGLGEKPLKIGFKIGPSLEIASHVLGIEPSDFPWTFLIVRIEKKVSPRLIV